MPRNDLISDSDIESIYKDDNLIVTNNISSNCETDDSKKSLVKIFDKDGNDMIQREIERVYFRSKELFSNKEETGKV